MSGIFLRINNTLFVHGQIYNKKTDQFTYNLCNDFNKWINDPNILELFFNGRHHHISFILTMQYSVGIPPEMRSNFDYIFLLAEDSFSNIKRMHEHYAGMFPTFQMFCQFMDQCTENYECVVIDNKIQSNKLEDTIFWYKGEVHGEFKLGAPDLWRQSEMLARVKEEDDVNNYDPRASMKLRGPAINVNKKY